MKRKPHQTTTRTHRVGSRSVLVLLLSFGVGCGGAQGTPKDAAGGSHPAIPWSQRSFAEKRDTMVSTVLPDMKALFVAYDSHRYAKMSCATCHGPDAQRLGYLMPNPDLLLDRAEADAAVNNAPSSTAMARFMATQVDPAMKRLLGKDTSRPGCFGCHTPER